MIVRERLPWIRLLFTFRGSSLEQTWPRIAAATMVAVVVTFASLYYEVERYSFTTAPFMLIGVALGIFLGFRNNASYDRFWEGRKLWGALVNTCRTLARQAESLVDVSPEQQDEIFQFREGFTRRVVAFAHALRLHLRDEDAPEQFQEYLSAEEYADTVHSKHRPLAILAALGRHEQQAKHSGWLFLGLFAFLLGKSRHLAHRPISCSFSPAREPSPNHCFPAPHPAPQPRNLSNFRVKMQRLVNNPVNRIPAAMMPERSFVDPILQADQFGIRVDLFR